MTLKGKVCGPVGLESPPPQWRASQRHQWRHRFRGRGRVSVMRRWVEDRVAFHLNRWASLPVLAMHAGSP